VISRASVTPNELIECPSPRMSPAESMSHKITARRGPTSRRPQPPAVKR
jgi:hypothetical protein